MGIFPHNTKSIDVDLIGPRAVDCLRRLGLTWIVLAPFLGPSQGSVDGPWGCLPRLLKPKHARIQF